MKKKLLIIPLIIILTGCLDQSAKGYITKTCTKEENINGNKVLNEIKITSKTGNIETIIIKETYDKNMDLNAITNSKKSEQTLYKKQKGIDININENIILYTIKTNEVTEDIKEKFKIKNEQHQQIKYYEDNGYICK